MKRTLALAIATFLVLHSTTTPADARNAIQMPPRTEYIYYLRQALAKDPATAKLKVTNQSLLKTGEGWCYMIRQKVSLNSVYQLIQSDPDISKSPSFIKLHRAIVDQALWSLCSDQHFKMRSPDAVEWRAKLRAKSFRFFSYKLGEFLRVKIWRCDR